MLVDTVRLGLPTRPRPVRASVIQPTETLGKNESRLLVRCLAGGALAGGPKPGIKAELSIRDHPTALAVLWVDGGQLAKTAGKEARYFYRAGCHPTCHPADVGNPGKLHC